MDGLGGSWCHARRRTNHSLFGRVTCTLRRIAVYLFIMKFYSSWNNTQKQADKYQIKVRLGRLTAFDFYTDRSDRKWALTLFNFTVKS